jgi:acetate kinase
MKSDTDAKRILVLNCGSSSLKYRLYSVPGETCLAFGEVERVGIKTRALSLLSHSALGRSISREEKIENHAQALSLVLDVLESDFGDPHPFDCIGHRYVHPGPSFGKTARVTGDVLARLESTLSLAPIHNPVAYNLMRAIAEKYPGLDQYLVFDTTFHRTIPPELATYAIPFEIAERYGIRKIGFHGISHQYVMEEACRFLGVAPDTQRIISCHLGTGGASICAIERGRSINSSMGFTPLEGLIMNTRSGDIDIGLVLSSMYRGNIKTDDMETILNNKSGVLGMYESSSDLRDIVSRLADDERAERTFGFYVERIRKYIAYNILLLGKADILVFTDTLGVNVPVLRKRVLEYFGFMGIVLDDGLNDSASAGIRDIAGRDSEAQVLVIPTNEELFIARETYKEMRHDTRY